MPDHYLPVVVVHGVGSGKNKDRAGFSKDNVKSAYAVIECNGSTYSYSVKKYGGSKKANTVIGVYWGEN